MFIQLNQIKVDKMKHIFEQILSKIAAASLFCFRKKILHLRSVTSKRLRQTLRFILELIEDKQWQL